MTCYLLHIMEDPDQNAYRDPNLRDLVGELPRFFCAKSQPLTSLLPSQAVKCMRINEPCWKPAASPGEAAPPEPPPEPPSGGPYTF